MQPPVLAMPVAPTAPLAPAAPLAAAPASSTAVRADPGRRISLATQLQVRRLTCLTCLTWQEQHVVSGTAIVAVLREKRTVVSELVNLAVPALLTQEKMVAAEQVREAPRLPKATERSTSGAGTETRCQRVRHRNGGERYRAPDGPFGADAIRRQGSPYGEGKAG